MISFLSNAVLVVKRMQQEAYQQKCTGGREHGCRKTGLLQKGRRHLRGMKFVHMKRGEYMHLCAA